MKGNTWVLSNTAIAEWLLMVHKKVGEKEICIWEKNVVGLKQMMAAMKIKMYQSET